MAVTFGNVEWVGPDRRRVYWSSDQEDPVYRVFVNGRPYGETAVNNLVVDVADVLEVFDDDTLPSPAGAPQALLTWPAVADTAYYRIERYIDSAWVEIDQVAPGGGNQEKYQTPVLDDEGSEQFRVIPVGTNGKEGNAATITVKVVRHPTPPPVNYAYDGGTGKVTITT